MKSEFKDIQIPKKKKQNDLSSVYTGVAPYAGSITPFKNIDWVYLII
jgi:hypothetical protein